jgi:hypothetical protein
MFRDHELKEDVLAEFRWEPSLTSDHIEVTANRGVITLTGQVPHFPEKSTAEQAAMRVKGVKAVVQELEVRLPDTMTRDDQDIARGQNQGRERLGHVVGTSALALPAGCCRADNQRADRGAGRRQPRHRQAACQCGEHRPGHRRRAAPLVVRSAHDLGQCGGRPGDPLRQCPYARRTLDRRTNRVGSTRRDRSRERSDRRRLTLALRRRSIAADGAKCRVQSRAEVFPMLPTEKADDRSERYPDHGRR